MTTDQRYQITITTESMERYVVAGLVTLDGVRSILTQLEESRMLMFVTIEDRAYILPTRRVAEVKGTPMDEPLRTEES